MPTRNVHLTQYFNELITTGINSGRFSNASEMVREGLRLLEQREEEDRAKLEWLRTAVREAVEAMERGEYTTLDSPDEIEPFLRSLRPASRLSAK